MLCLRLSVVKRLVTVARYIIICSFLLCALDLVIWGNQDNVVAKLIFFVEFFKLYLSSRLQMLSRNLSAHTELFSFPMCSSFFMLSEALSTVGTGTAAIFSEHNVPYVFGTSVLDIYSKTLVVLFWISFEVLLVRKSSWHLQVALFVTSAPLLAELHGRCQILLRNRRATFDVVAIPTRSVNVPLRNTYVIDQYRSDL